MWKAKDMNYFPLDPGTFTSCQSEQPCTFSEVALGCFPILNHE